MQRGQAMLETVIAVLFISFLFLGLFQLSHLMTAKILCDHAAARAARARAVGFNDFMCLKSARVAVIPVAGERRWPEAGTDFDELARIPIYLCTDTPALANGVLEYERWGTMKMDVDSGFGISPTAEAEISMQMPRFLGSGGGIEIEGKAEIESHYPFYMQDQGL